MKAVLVLGACFTLFSFGQFPYHPTAQEQAAAIVVDGALRDARSLHPGMKRRDVEKLFENASLVFSSPTVYTYRRCPTIHISVEYKLALGHDFSPEDAIVSVSQPYLDDVTTD